MQKFIPEKNFKKIMIFRNKIREVTKIKNFSRGIKINFNSLYTLTKQ